NPTSFTQAFAEFLRQMQNQSVTVQQATVSSSVVAGGGNTGTPTIVVGLYDQNGLLLEYPFAETMVLTCTQDQFHGGTAGSEQVAVLAPATQPANSYLWPAGSGTSVSLTVIDPAQGNGAGGNLLSGGGTAGAFKAFTGSVPTGWTINAGGTLITDGTTGNYAGTAHCLLITGDGATQADLFQPFANGGIATGSSQALLSNTAYTYCMRVQK